MPLNAYRLDIICYLQFFYNAYMLKKTVHSIETVLVVILTRPDVPYFNAATL